MLISLSAVSHSTCISCTKPRFRHLLIDASFHHLHVTRKEDHPSSASVSAGPLILTWFLYMISESSGSAPWMRNTHRRPKPRNVVGYNMIQIRNTHACGRAAVNSTRVPSTSTDTCKIVGCILTIRATITIADYRQTSQKKSIRAPSARGAS